MAFLWIHLSSGFTKHHFYGFCFLRSIGSPELSLQILLIHDFRSPIFSVSQNWLQVPSFSLSFLLYYFCFLFLYNLSISLTTILSLIFHSFDLNIFFLAAGVAFLFLILFEGHVVDYFVLIRSSEKKKKER